MTRPLTADDWPPCSQRLTRWAHATACHCGAVVVPHGQPLPGRAEVERVHNTPQVEVA